MPNNPVQIILNDQDFLRAPDPGQGGPDKDFFENADRAFLEHQAALAAAIDQVKTSIKAAGYGPAAYVKVQMRDEALAKSYRPNRVLFRDEQFPCVGADGVGTLYFRAPLIYLPALRARLIEAEKTVEVRTSRATGREYKAPSRARSEVGAIATIEIAPPIDKRSFSTAAAMQMFADPRTVSGYQIELFETPAAPVIADDPLGRYALLESLQKVLVGLGLGARTFLASQLGRTPVLELQLTTSDQEAIVDNRLGIARRDIAPLPRSGPVDRNPQRHEEALVALARHPLVRSIRPPVQLQLTDLKAGQTRSQPEIVAIPSPSANAAYPIVGIIDSGVAQILDPWIVDRFDYLAEADYDATHGTGVAGIVTIGQTTNSPNVAPEPDGCKIYDAPLYPKRPFMDQYPNGFADFLEELESAVVEARETHGVRIFNLSINAVSEVERYRYSIYAARLDQISDQHDVIFVNSAGNLPPGQARAAWQKRPSDVISYLAARAQADTIYKPAESVRSVSVGALNPPDTEEIAGAPTRYTTRGPGLQVGVKPDVAAYGGAAAPANKPTGLASIRPDGAKVDIMGTSYAAPLIARTLAGLDVATQGGLSSEALRAMLLHHSFMPEPLTRRARGLKDIARQFAGFGQPQGAARMLETADHQITMVFQSRLTIGERRPAILRFDFAWPQSLVEANGACSGRARMTLVYAPPLDPAFGAELARVNLDANLLQRQPKIRQDGAPSYTNQIAARYLPNTTGLGIPEKALIDHGLKWWPAKQYESTFAAKGEYSNWRLEVTSLVRAEAEFPPQGVPFAVILTIEDPEGGKPIFAEMRQMLDASHAQARDIRTAIRVRPRA